MLKPQLLNLEPWLIVPELATPNAGATAVNVGATAAVELVTPNDPQLLPFVTIKPTYT